MEELTARLFFLISNDIMTDESASEHTADEKFMDREILDLCRFMEDPEEILELYRKIIKDKVIQLQPLLYDSAGVFPVWSE